MENVYNLQEYAEHQVQLIDGAIADTEQELSALYNRLEALSERRTMWLERTVAGVAMRGVECEQQEAPVL